jgi:hypothetical protein
LLILIAFIAWDIPEGVTFPKIESSEPLARSSLRYGIQVTWKKMAVKRGVPNLLSTAKEGH